MAKGVQKPSITILLWTCGFLEKSFVALALAFARRDASAAREMIHTLNADLARELIEQQVKGAPGGGLMWIGERLRDTLKKAAKAIDDAGKPH